MKDNLTEAEYYIVQNIIGAAISEGLHKSAEETSHRAAVAFALPALSSAIGSLLAVCETEEGREEGITLCVNTIKSKMKQVDSLMEGGTLQ